MKQRLTPWRQAAVVLSDGLLLLLGLYGALFSFLSAVPLPVEERALLLPLFLLGLSALALFSLPKGRWRLVLALLCLASLGAWIWEHLPALKIGVLTAAQAIETVFIRRAGMRLVVLDLATLLEGVEPSARLEGLSLLLSGLSALLALLLGWATVGRRSFWLSFWLTFPILLFSLVITPTPGWLPLSALLLFWGMGLLTRLVKKPDPWGSAKLSLLALPPLALFLVLTSIFSQNYYETAQWVAPARQAAVDRVTGLSRSMMAMGPLTGAGLGNVEANLRAAGPLRFTGTTVLRVEGDITGHIYLRGFSAGRYTDLGWQQLEDAEYEKMREGWSFPVPDPTITLSPSDHMSWLTAAGQSLISVPGIGDAQPLNFPALGSGASDYRFTVENTGPAAPYVFLPYQLSTTPAHMAGASFVNDAYVARSPGVRRYYLYAKPQASPLEGTGLTGEQAQAEAAYQSFVLDHYTQVPEALTPIFEQLWEKYSLSAPSPAEAAQAVAQILAWETQYDPETPRTPEGEDFVAYFLTASRRGYCMHYASAATLFLRHLGYPARYVSGYTADVKAGQTVSVPDERAHAWVEVYIAGYGWHPVEVTPGFSSPALEASTPQPTPAPTPSATPSPPHTPSVAPTPSAAPPSGTDKGSLWEQLSPFLLPSSLLALGALLLVLWRRLAALHRTRVFGGADTNRAVIAMYRYAVRLLRYGGEDELPPGPELLGQKAKFSSHTLTSAERAEMASYVADLAMETDCSLTTPSRLVFRYVLGLY